MGKVIYGLKNVHYALYDSATNTYGAWKRIPGAVSLSADVEVSQNNFYADDTVYAVINSAMSESGSIEFAACTDEMYVDLFGYEVGTNGVRYQLTDPIPVTVALGYETAGNEIRTRGVRYNVTITPPSQSANSLTDSTDPDTVTANYTAVGRDFTLDGETKNVLKMHCDEGTTAYTNFFNSVITPSGSGTANVRLSALALSNVTLDQAFNPTITSYVGTTTSASGTITATAADTDATVTIMVNGSAYSSSASYNSGENIVTILVTNDTAVALYKVLVTRGA